jgi:hypothetical protein
MAAPNREQAPRGMLPLTPAPTGRTAAARFWINRTGS